MALTDKLTAIGDAIREKTGGTDALTLDGMVEAIAGIEAGGGEDYLAKRIGGSLTEYSSNEVRDVKQYSFHSVTLLKSVSLPAATTVGQNAFYGCSALASVNLPLITSIYGSAFRNCPKLASADFPMVTDIREHAFNGCSELASVNFPLINTFASSVFYNCFKLASVNFPLVTSVGNSSFYNCSKLASADFPLVTSIYGNAFYGCSALSALVLRSETMCSLSATSAFTNSAIAKGTGYIYVPDALVDSYKTATNWSTYASQIKPLSEYVEVTE